MRAFTGAHSAVTMRRDALPIGKAESHRSVVACKRAKALRWPIVRM